jgi:membrane protein
MSSGERPRLRDLDRGQWLAVADGMRGRFSKLAITDHAAALTYYGLLSLFPALLVGVALLALFGSYPETYNSIVDTLRDAAPGTAVETVNSALRDVLRSRGDAGALLGLGLVISLYSASGAMGAAIRSLEAINGVEDGRSFFSGIAVRLALTVAVMALFGVAFLAVVVAGPLFGAFAEAAGIGGNVSDFVGYLRWPIGATALLGAFSLLYALAPRKGPRAAGEFLPGAALGALLWFASSLLFTSYVSHFGSYDATYGTLGAMISLLVWLWLGNIAFLLGALFNAELRGVLRAGT